MTRRKALVSILLAALVTSSPAKFVPPRDDSLSDNFEAYDDQAEFEKAWSKIGTPAHTLDDTLGHDSKKSIKLADPNPAARAAVPMGAGNRYYHDLRRALTPSDDLPVTFSIDIHLDPAGAPDNWQRVWQTVDIRGYTGGSYGQGDLTAIVSLGLAYDSLDAWSTEYFQSRVLLPPAAVPDPGKQYYTLDAEPNAPKRSPGWHTLTARIGSTAIRYYVDGTLAETLKIGITKPLTTLVIGSDVSCGGQTLHVDNLSIHQGPLKPAAPAPQPPRK